MALTMIDALKVESWTWYAVGCAIMIARYTSRGMQLGSIRKFQGDDFVMLVVFGFYTSLIISMNIVSSYDSNLMNPEDIPLLTNETIRQRSTGSKLVLVVEQSMIMTTWGCKICLLLMYQKLTFGLKAQFAVKVIAAYVVGGWVLMEILYFGVWCRPFNQYWAVPVKNIQCSAATHHLIVNAVLNISSDVFMLAIPIPIVITSQLPRAKKCILCGLFSMGLFVIMCACLNKFYSFHDPFSPMWTFWYIREASTAVYVANMPMCWSLLRRVFNLRAFNGDSSLTSGSKSRTARSNLPYGTGTGTDLGTKSGNRGKKSDKSWWDNDRAVTRTGSEEYIVMDNTKGKSVPLEIWESKVFEVMEDDDSIRGDSKRDLGGPKVVTVVSAAARNSSDSSGSARHSRT